MTNLASIWRCEDDQLGLCQRQRDRERERERVGANCGIVLGLFSACTRSLISSRVIDLIHVHALPAITLSCLCMCMYCVI